jgi:hypothetical protein
MQKKPAADFAARAYCCDDGHMPVICPTRQARHSDARFEASAKATENGVVGNISDSGNQYPEAELLQRPIFPKTPPWTLPSRRRHENQPTNLHIFLIAGQKGRMSSHQYLPIQLIPDITEFYGRSQNLKHQEAKSQKTPEHGASVAGSGPGDRRRR